MIRQKMAIACFKNGSDEMAGLAMNYVLCEDDDIFDRYLHDDVLNISSLID